MSAAERELVTPEAVVLDLGVAGLATRTLAKLLDLVCLGMVAAIAAAVAGLVGVLSGSGVLVTVLVAVGLFVVVVALPTLCETWWNGRTPGKAAFGLRVVTDEGGPISFRHAALRGLLGVAEVPTGLGLVVALANPLNKRMGDLAAGTQVIVDRPWQAPLVPVVFFPPAGREQFVDTLDVGRVTAEHFLLLRSFLLRVAELDAGARWHMAHRLAEALRGVTAPDPPVGIDAESFLICVASAFQAWHGGLPERPTAPPSAPPSWPPPAAPPPGTAPPWSPHAAAEGSAPSGSPPGGPYAPRA